jgi:hypothetical protein
MHGGDIKTLLGVTSHYMLMNLMFKMSLLNLTISIKHNIDKNNVNISILILKKVFVYFQFQC